jgi:hypothetical protein
MEVRGKGRERVDMYGEDIRISVSSLYLWKRGA